MSNFSAISRALIKKSFTLPISLSLHSIRTKSVPPSRPCTAVSMIINRGSYVGDGCRLLLKSRVLSQSHKMAVYDPPDPSPEIFPGKSPPEMPSMPKGPSYEPTTAPEVPNVPPPSFDPIGPIPQEVPIDPPPNSPSPNPGPDSPVPPIPSPPMPDTPIPMPEVPPQQRPDVVPQRPPEIDPPPTGPPDIVPPPSVPQDLPPPPGGPLWSGLVSRKHRGL